MEDKALRRRGLEDEIAIYEIKLARMREKRETIIGTIIFFALLTPIFFLINLKYALLGFIATPVCAVIGAIVLHFNKRRYSRLVEVYNSKALEMAQEGGKE